MIRKPFALVFLALVWLSPAWGQSSVIGGGVWGDAKKSASYAGPGDVLTGWQAWYGLRAFSAATLGNRLINVCNVSDVVCADLSSSPTTGALVVTTIGGSNCAVVTCTIKTFYDQSGASACSGPCDNTQTTIANRATLVVSCSGLASQPCSQFTTTQFYHSAVLATTYSQPFSASLVYNRYSGTNYGGGINFLSPDSRFGVEGSANQFQVYAGSVVDVTEVDGSFNAANGVFNGSNCAVQINGTDTTASNCGTNGAGNLVGLNFSAGQGSNIEINEAGMNSGGFTSGNRTSLNNQQRSFWGF